jgi:transposase
LASQGTANTAIASRLQVSSASVVAWRERFAEEGLAKFGQVRPGRGRKPSIPAAKVEEIVQATLHEKPPGETHWSCRSMAKAKGVSKDTVQRIWSARGLHPHRVETFKLSNDKRFEEKLTDVVGLYLNPPDKAVVLCVDEKSQIQALDRTQPSLPMKKGRAGTMTHDYKRNGTTTLFAALNVLTGIVIGQCLPKHRNTEFLRFLRTIDRQVPKGLQIHMVLDNYGTHKHPNVVAWLAKHPLFHLHFVPTSSSWAEHGGTVVPRDHAKGDPARRVQVGAGSRRRHRGVLGGEHRRPAALRLDGHRRADTGEGPERKSHP